MLCMAFGKTIYYTLITDTTNTHAHAQKETMRSVTEQTNERAEQTNERMNVLHNIYLNSGKVYVLDLQL